MLDFVAFSLLSSQHFSHSSNYSSKSDANLALQSVCVFFKKNNKIKTKLRSDLPWNYHKVVYVDDWLPCIFFISLYTELRKIEANTLALLCFAVLFPIQINTFEILFRFILLLFRIHLVYTCVYVFSEVFFRYSVPFYRNDTFEARL